MDLTIEVERESWLREEARRCGVQAEQLAGEMLDDLLQDLEDGEEARRRIDSGEIAISFAQFEAKLDASLGSSRA